MSWAACGRGLETLFIRDCVEAAALPVVLYINLHNVRNIRCYTSHAKRLAQKSYAEDLNNAVLRVRVIFRVLLGSVLFSRVIEKVGFVVDGD